MFFATELSRLEKDEEEIRQKVQLLTESQRKYYYDRLDSELRDPDTYAVLNYFFIAGIHHFYLKRYLRGIIEVSLYLLGFGLLLGGAAIVGFILLLGVSLVEISSLFRSQVIVKQHNLQLMRDILHEASHKR
jgi:hypothetical protein